MAKCPKCHTQVAETTKFCSKCGEELPKGTSDPAWIAAMQEKIEEAKAKRAASRRNLVLGAVLTVVSLAGIIISCTVSPGDTLLLLLWVAGVAGVLIIIISLVEILLENLNKKNIRYQLAKGKK